MSTPFSTNNPGIGGIDELTPAEEAFIMSLVGLSYTEGDILYYTSGAIANLGVGSEGQVLTISSGLPAWTSVAESGDMLKSVYDTDNNGIVDNSSALGGQNGAYYLSRTNHTGTQTASTISDFSAAALAAAPAETASTVGALVSGATAKTTPVDADTIGLSDSAASNVLKKVTWANVKATLKTYFDTLYQPLDATLTALAGLSTGANKIPYSTGTDTFGQLDFKDEDNMASDSATAVPSQQSVKAYVDGLLAGIGGATELDVNQTTHGFSVGDVIKYASGSYSKAQADSAANAEAIGVVSAVADANNFTVTQTGYITGLSGLTANTVYFLDPSTAGAITATEPSTVGQISKPVFFATSTTAGWVLAYRGVAIADSGSVLTTKGDLLTYDTGDVRLGVGTDGQVLTADSTQAKGVKWADAGGGSIWTELYSETLSSADTDITTTTFTGYDYLRIVLENVAHDAVSGSRHIFMQFNGDTGASIYGWSCNVGETETSGSETGQICVGYSIQDYEQFYADLLFYNKTTDYKRGFGLMGGRFRNNGQQVTNSMMMTTAEYGSNTRVTSIKIYPSSGNLESGSTLKVYGSNSLL